jgi:hypothetical protein
MVHKNRYGGVQIALPRGDFWSATVIAFAVFRLGATYGHIRDMWLRRNLAPGNAGPVFYINDVLSLAACRFADRLSRITRLTPSKSRFLYQTEHGPRMAKKRAIRKLFILC